MSGSLARRSAPEALVSDEASMNGTTAVNIKYSSNNISGCHLYGIVVTNATGAASCASGSILSIMSASNELMTVMLAQTDKIPIQTSFNFSAPIPIDSNLKLKTNKAGNKFKVRCLVQTY